MSVARALGQLGGTATWSELRRQVSKRTLLAAVADGAVVRRSRGLYCLPERTNFAVARMLRGAISHLSAAQVWDLGILTPPAELHITVSRHRSRVRAPAGVCVHYGVVTDADLDAGVTGALRTVVDCAKSCSVPQALAVADTAVRTALVTKAELLRAVTQLRGTGSGRARRVARWVDPRAASPLESALRGLLYENGLTRFQPQFRVMSRGRLVATTDLGDAETGVLLKADSFLWHGDRAALDRDARRYNELVVRGYLVLRFSWEQVVGDPAWVVAVVRLALGRPDRQASTARMPA